MDRNSGSCFDAGSGSSSEVLEYALQRRSIARKDFSGIGVRNLTNTEGDFVILPLKKT